MAEQTDARRPLHDRFGVLADVSRTARDKKHRIRDPFTQQTEGRKSCIDSLLSVQPCCTQYHRDIICDRERGSYRQASIPCERAEPR